MSEFEQITRVYIERCIRRQQRATQDLVRAYESLLADQRRIKIGAEFPTAIPGQLLSKQFKAALGIAGMSITAFARGLGVTPPAIHMVISGKRKSDRILTAVNSLIEKRLSQTEAN